MAQRGDRPTGCWTDSISPVLLAAHPEERIWRQPVASGWPLEPRPGIIGRLAWDESLDVRAVVAHETERAMAAALGERDAIRELADGPHYAVRHAYVHRPGQT
jgi:hypothetical protein